MTAEQWEGGGGICAFTDQTPLKQAHISPLIMFFLLNLEGKILSLCIRTSWLYVRLDIIIHKAIRIGILNKT